MREPLFLNYDEKKKDYVVCRDPEKIEQMYCYQGDEAHEPLAVVPVSVLFFAQKVFEEMVVARQS